MVTNGQLTGSDHLEIGKAQWRRLNRAVAIIFQHQNNRIFIAARAAQRAIIAKLKKQDIFQRGIIAVAGRLIIGQQPVYIKRGFNR
jgi:predicted transcriptional regulator YheO